MASKSSLRSKFLISIRPIIGSQWLRSFATSMIGYFCASFRMKCGPTIDRLVPLMQADGGIRHRDLIIRCQRSQIDLAVTWRFNLLRLRPIIYPLQGFGIPCELERVYDYRHVPKINRSLLRDTAANVLQVQEGTASILAQDATDSVSALDPDDDLSVSTTASKLKHRLGSIFVPGSTQDGDSMTIPSPSAARRALMRRDSQSTMLTSVPLLSAEHNKETRRLHGPSLQRLVPKFPVRDKRDRSDNIFEARAVGIGAARVSIFHACCCIVRDSNKLLCANSLQEEDEKALQDELKKRQVRSVHHCLSQCPVT
jgi:hypothetical protein